MGRRETMTTSTRRYLRESPWLNPRHPLAVALLRTAEELDARYQASTMSQYSKLLEQAERLRPPPGQGQLPGTEAAGNPDLRLIGPAHQVVS